MRMEPSKMDAAPVASDGSRSNYSSSSNKLKYFFSLVFRWMKGEPLSIFRLAWPIAVSYLLKQSIFLVSLIFCGHIDENSSVSLDAAGLALSFINITGFSVAMGLGAAMDTLASQAWGAKSYIKVGIYLQRGILVLALAMLPVYALWVNIESVLNLLLQPPCVVEQARDYIHIFSSCLPALFLNILLERYIQVQNIVYPLIITGVIANIVNIVAHSLFVLVAKWGVRGAGASTALSMYALTVSLVIIILAKKMHKKTWGGWTKEALKDWGQFARYGIPGFFMLSVEWWSFELGYIVAGTLDDGEIQQGIHAILINYATLIFMVPYSLSLAVTVRVGNELGAGHPKAAKHSFIIGLILHCTWLLLIEVFTVSLKTEFVKLFTSDPCLLQAISVPLFLFLINVAGDHTQGFLSGVVRGCGRQLSGAITNIFSYSIGVSVGIVLAIVAHLGVAGYWLGLSVAVGIQTVTYSTILFTMSWKKQSVKAQKMAKLVLSESGEGDGGETNEGRPSKDMSVEMVPLGEPSTTTTDGGNDQYSPQVDEMGHESVKLLAVTVFDDVSPETSSSDRQLSDGGGSLPNGVSDNFVPDSVGTPPNEPLLDTVTEECADDEHNSDILDHPDINSRVIEIDIRQDIPLMSDVEEDDNQTEEAVVNPSTVSNPCCVCLPLKTIVYRIVLVSIVVGLLVVSVVISQLFVYKPITCSTNITMTSNVSNESCISI